MKGHGTRASYARGCRCLPCRAANSSYQSERRRAGGREVEAGPARAHLLALRRTHVGLRAVSDVTGIDRRVLYEIASGRRKIIFRKTLATILSIDEGCRANHSLVDAKPAWRRINEMLERGYTKKQLAAWLGSKARVPQLSLRRDRISARSAMRVEQLYSKVEAGLVRRER